MEQPKSAGPSGGDEAAEARADASVEDPGLGSGSGPGSGPGPVDELAVIERIRARVEALARAPAGETWIGDDAAVMVPPATNGLLLATDLVVDGVHVDRTWASEADIGAKAVMVTVSDLAAMGGVCDAVLLSVAAPAGTDLDELAGAAADAARAAGGALVGGDLSAGGVLTVSVAVLGHLPVPDDVPALLRSGARPGDTVFVTGALGAAAAGLRLLRQGWRPGRDGADAHGASEQAAVARQLRPEARLAAGIAARRARATAAIDLSDGLSTDAARLAEASGVGLVLSDLPAAPAADRSEALHGGEDYELLVTTADPAGLVTAYERAGLPPPAALGTCDDRSGQVRLDGLPLDPEGWQHRF